MELIDREEVWKAFESNEYDVSGGAYDKDGYSANAVWDILSDIPAVDAVPVVHGHWIKDGSKEDIYCSRCKRWFNELFHVSEDWSLDEMPEYCSFCGAKMDEVVNDE